MKLLRVLISGLLLVLAAVGASLWYAAQHANQLVSLILAQIGERTGIVIETSSIRLGFGTRLVVVLEGARVVVNHRETARLNNIRAVFSYSALLRRTGLPLNVLVLERGTIIVGHEPSGPLSPQSVASRLQALSHYLDELTNVSQRIELADIAFLSPGHRPVVEHASGLAYREHHQQGTGPWIVSFTAQIDHTSMRGARLAGDLQLSHVGMNPGALAQGQLRFWEIPLHHLKLADLDASAHLEADLDLAVSTDAQATGDFKLTMHDLVVDGPGLRTALNLGRLWSRGDYRLSQTRGELSNFELYRGQQRLVGGGARIFNIYNSSRAITFSASAIALELTDTPKLLRALQAVPAPLLNFADRIRSGTLIVNEVILKNPEPLEELQPQALARKLAVNAVLTRFSYVPPPDLRLPNVYQFDAQINYSNASARIIQATGQVGGSSISDMSVELNLSKAPDEISYRLKLASWLDVGELYDAASGVIKNAQPTLRGQLLWVHGHSSIQLQAKGALDRLRPTFPRDYLISADARDVEFELKRIPTAIWLNSGSIAVEPGRISIKRVITKPLDQPGNLVVNGVILPPEPLSPRL
ncbi:MAG: hypothetical protein JO166_11790, partial [Deltaproteobacteria bacterium]|nr:hypothetical protein [Deltaproteobacteria bacterium]